MHEEIIYTISSLNYAAHTLLDNQLGWIKVQGEISNLKKASSGHCYFSLKDSTAQVNCVLFASAAYALTHVLDNGKQVLATAKVGLYQPRGDYQLNVKHLEDAGAGLLQIAFEQLKKKLAEQGLFDSQFKQPLPATPRVIGIVTSPHGAAIRDVLATLKRRFVAANVIIYPTDVQGQQAAPKIAKAIHIANHRKECDVLIVTRGGGSAEDLWPFNEEVVAWAIFNSQIPIVTGIGHQIDTSIADYVADYATSTPTAAAEAVTPNQKDWLTQTRQFLTRAHRAAQYAIDYKKQTLDHRESALQLHIRHYLTQKKIYLHQLNDTLNKKNPFILIQTYQARLMPLIQRLHQQWQQQLHVKQQRFSACLAALRVVSPLGTLERGYALAMTLDNHIVRTRQDIQCHDTIRIQLATLQLRCTVEEILPC